MMSEDRVASSERVGGQFESGSLIIMCGVMSDIAKELSDVPSDVPNVLAAFPESSVGPPFGTPTDPGFSLGFWLHRFETHAEFEVLHLVMTFGHSPMSIERFHLGSDDCTRHVRRKREER